MKIYPQDYFLFNIKGNCNLKNYQIKKGIENFRKSIECNKKFWPAYENLFNVLEKSNKIQDFKDLLDKANNYFKNDDNLNFFMALYYYRIKKIKISNEILLNVNVNSHKSKSNDIREIYELLGIEAARKALAIELENVIGEGKLNYRHLSLLVDTMTSRGQLMSIDRHGINRSDVGPLAKSSFEETTDMLVNASIFSEYDNLNGISANVMLGHKAPCGTGDFNVLINENKFINVMKNFNNVIIENNNIADEDINQDDIFININLPEVKKNNSKCFNRFI